EIGSDLLNSKYFGLIFRTASKFATEEEIKQDFISLEKTYNKIQELISKMPNEIGMIYSSSQSLNLLFPYPFKKKLDENRNKIVETINLHHTIKSLSTNENRMATYYADEKELLNYSEDLIGYLSEEQREKIENFYLKKYYDNIQLDEWMNIDHLKLSGENIHLKGGKIKSFHKKLNKNNLKIVLKRKFREGGKYDGLNKPIQRGDYALSTYKLNNWYYVSKYFSANNELKGKYININTPIEISNHKIQYIDLEIDVIEYENGEREIIDEDKLETIHDLKLISEEIYKRALELAEELKESKNLG
ncbi:MAG: DUF402 domain-containing protein, partial [Promethearchaeota archaeon]